MSDAQPEVNPDVKPETAAEEVVVSTELKNIIEALIFASDEPMTVRFIRSIVDDVNKDRSPSDHYAVNADIIRKAVADLNRGYTKMGTGFRIIEIAGGFTYATQEQFSSWVGKLAKEKARRRLSPTAVETLAIIAYKQPIAKGEVEFIRGVNVDYIINALLEKDLIHITGRANTPGRPLLYGTTQKFLEHFGLNDLTDLPKPREIAELINETEIEVDRRLLAEQQELEFKEDLEKKLEGNEGSKNKPVKQPKVKVPENIKEENRRAAKKDGDGTPAPAEQTSADGQRSAEGESSSESNSTTAEAALTVPENGQALPVENAPVHSEGSEAVREQGPADSAGSVLLPEEAHSEAEPVQDMAHLPEAATAAEAEEPKIAAPDHRPADGQEVSAESGLEPSIPVSPSSVPTVREETPAETETAAAGAEAVHATIPEEVTVRGPEQSPTAGAPMPQAGMEQSAQGQEKGWSKWKNKVKTFFQKLFA